MRDATVPFYRALAQGAALAAAAVVPLYFVVFSDAVFEPEKAALTRALAVMAAAALVAGRLAARPAPSGSATASARPDAGALPAWRALARHPLALAAAAVWATEALSSALSVAPWSSVMGTATRGQGLLTTSALLVLFAAAASLGATPAGRARLAAFVAVTALPAGLYGAVQRAGLDPLPWQGDVVTRVAGPAGNSVLLAAHLVVALPLAIWLTARAWRAAARTPSAWASVRLAAWLLVDASAIAGLVLAGSRGPLAGAVAGLLVVALAAAARAGRRRAALGGIAAAALSLAFVAWLNVPGGPLAPLARVPVLDRLSTALDPGSSTVRVRLRLWEGSAEAIAAAPARALVGRGPETMERAWAPYYPPILAYDEPRGMVPDRAHNLAVDALLTVGALGLAARLAFVLLAVDAALAQLGAVARSGRWRRIASWLAAGALAAVAARLADPSGSWRLAGPALGAGLAAGVAGSLWLAAARGGRSEATASAAIGQATASGFAAAALALLVAHLVELQVGFEVTATRLVVWLVAGALAGRAAAGATRDLETPAVAGRDANGVRLPDRSAPAVAALLVGATLIFDLARPGLVAGGPAVATGMIAAATAIAFLAVGTAAGEAGAPPGGRGALLVLAGLAGYGLAHRAALGVGVAGPATAVSGGAATMAAYAALVAVVLVAWARQSAGGRPRGRALALGAAVLAPAALASLWLFGAPVVASALVKEGRLGWQAPAAEVRRGGDPGRAESFLDRADRRYARAARLAPWEPEIALARARLAVERADLLDGRLSRRLAAAGRADAPDEYAAGLLNGAAADLAAERDAAFEAALGHADHAEALAGPWPIPAITRARALRLWGDRTRRADLRAERLAAARASYDAATARAPRWPELLDEAALTAALAGAPRDAVALAEAAIALDPFFVRAWRTAAGAHAALADDAAAAAAYAAYFEDYRNAGDLAAQRAHLAVLTRLGREAEALGVARTVTTLAPGDAHAHADLAVLLEGAGRSGEAGEAAQRAAALDPDDPAIAELAARLSVGATPDE